MSGTTSALDFEQPQTRGAPFEYETVIDEICRLDWNDLTQDEITGVAWAYYFFSVQFRENLEIARMLYPDDRKLRQLDREECNTSNLSPWPGVADLGEKMNHDEFMRRLLKLSIIDNSRRHKFKETGQAYLSTVRDMGFTTRALSIASYEDGGLDSVYRAMLRCRNWGTPPLQAFRHFLTEHIRFDNDPARGHGALCRHLAPDDQILPLWVAFKRLLIESVPELAANVGVA
jgi:hypothetical protein